MYLHVSLLISIFWCFYKIVPLFDLLDYQFSLHLYSIFNFPTQFLIQKCLLFFKYPFLLFTVLKRDIF